MPDETQITNGPRRLGLIFACAAAGLLSSVLTAGSMAVLDPLDPFVGVLFGAAMAICLSIRQRMWSAGRITAFIASSVMAYFAAIWAPLLLVGLLRFMGLWGGGGEPDEFSPAMFAIAGFTGAFVIALAVLLLFFQQKGWRTPAKACALALPGAFLGLVSALASPPVQAMFAQWFVPSRDWGVKREQFYSAYLIWQPGMAFVIAALVPRAVAVLFPSKEPVPVSGPAAKLSVGGKIFVTCMLAGTVLVGLGEAHYLLRQWQDHHVEKSQTP